MNIGRRALPALLGAAFSARALSAAHAAAASAGAAAPIRVGSLRFGSLAWELDVMRRHGLVQGFALDVVDFAAGSASQVALQAGNVDLVLQDWLWVSRQRAAGAGWTLAPVPSALGAIMAPANSPLRGVADLRGKRLGIAGGPLDKSWLLLRLYARQTAALDLDTAVEKTFGPPPLVAEQLRAGRLDATLTYWPFAARGEAQGLSTVLPMQDVLAGLGAPHDLPMLGFVFDQTWAAQNRAALQAFLGAAQAARIILLHSDAAWDEIAPLTRARGPAELTQLRDWYRRGFPGTWDAAAATRLFALLAKIGGPALVGSSKQLAPGTFWPA